MKNKRTKCSIGQKDQWRQQLPYTYTNTKHKAKRNTKQISKANNELIV